MAIPVISATQSVLGYKQWEYFEFQPYATNSPTRWSSNNALPDGLALDAPTKYAITGDSGTGIITATGHTIVAGDQVVIVEKTGGSSVAVDTIYFARDVVATTSLKLAATIGGAAVSLGSNITDGKISRKPTGKIIGAAEVPGVFVLGLKASNADGDSAEQQFTIGIEPGALVPDSLSWLCVDVVTGQLSVDGKEVDPLDAKALAALEKGETADVPFAFAVKEDDDLLARISFIRGTTVQDINLDALRLVVKEYEPDSVLVVSSEVFDKQGVSTGTNFLLHSKFDGAALAGALSNYEADTGTFFFALAEIEYVQVNPEYGDVGPQLLTRTSATFLIRIERDLAQG